MARKVGYDYDFVTAPPKSLECPVCLMTFRDPHVISCCGNEFCQLCIERVQRDGKPCPLCNEPNFTTMLHKKLVREVNGLVIRCPQKELGCEWEGELGQVEQHLNPGGGLSSSSGCGYVMVECSFQCSAHLQRRMVREHEMESCPKRPIEMQVASLMRKFEVITAGNKMLKQELVEMKEEMSEVKETHKQELNEMKEAHKQELKEVKEKINYLQEANEGVKRSFEELRKKQDAMKIEIDEETVRQKRKFYYLQTNLQTHTMPLPVPPFYFTIVNASHYLKYNMVYSSDPFYSHPGGYKLTASVYSYNSLIGANMWVSVNIQRGEFDDQLLWPFKGKVTVQVYNFTTEEWSNEETIVLNEEKCGVYFVQRCFDVQSHGRQWQQNFLSVYELQKHYTSSEDGSITRFRVLKVEF